MSFLDDEAAKFDNQPHEKQPLEKQPLEFGLRRHSYFIFVNSGSSIKTYFIRDVPSLRMRINYIASTVIELPAGIPPETFLKKDRFRYKEFDNQKELEREIVLQMQSQLLHAAGEYETHEPPSVG